MNRLSCGVLLLSLLSCSNASIINPPFTIEMDVRGDGSVLSAPAGIDCGSSCNAEFGGDNPVTLQARPAPGWRFDGWDDDCSGDETVLSLDYEDATGGSIFCQASFSLIPVVVPPEYATLSVRVLGPGAAIVGDVVCEDGELCRVVAAVGDVVVVQASPGPDGVLAGFGGDCVGLGNEATVTVDEDRSCTVSFLADDVAVPVRIEVRGPGRVTSLPAGINCVEGDGVGVAPGCVAYFQLDTAIELQAQGVGVSFRGWGRMCADAFDQPILSFDALATALTCTADFVREITLDINGSGRLVGINDPDVDCSSFCVVEAAAANLRVQAVPAFGWRVQSFGDGCVASDNDPTIAVLADNEDTCSVTFEVIPPTLTVTVIGDGSVSIDGGNACTDVCSVELSTGNHQLLAVADDDRVFAGWSGDCAGRTNPLTVTLNDQLSCSANFVMGVTLPEPNRFIPMAGVNGVAVSGDGNRIAVLTGSQVHVLNSDGQLQRSSPTPAGATAIVGISNNGDLIALTDAAFTIVVIAADGTSTFLTGHSGAVTSIDLSATLWASSDVLGRIKRWDPSTGLVQRTIAVHTGAAYGAAVVVGSDVVSVGADGRVVRTDGAGGVVQEQSLAASFGLGAVSSTTVVAVSGGSVFRLSTASLSSLPTTSTTNVSDVAGGGDGVWIDNGVVADANGALPSGPASPSLLAAGAGTVAALHDDGVVMWRQRNKHSELPNSFGNALIADPQGGVALLLPSAVALANTTLQVLPVPRAPRAVALGMGVVVADSEQLLLLSRTNSSSSLASVIINAVTMDATEQFVATVPQATPGAVVVRELPLGDVFRTLGSGNDVTIPSFITGGVLSAHASGLLETYQLSTGTLIDSAPIGSPIRQAIAVGGAAIAFGANAFHVVDISNLQINSVTTVDVPGCDGPAGFDGSNVALRCGNEVVIVRTDGATIAATVTTGVARALVLADGQLWFLDDAGLNVTTVPGG